MKTLILYASQTGTTKKYVDWLHESIKDSYIENLEGFPIEKLNQYDQYIFGSFTHGGQSPAQQFVIDNWDTIKNKKVFLFAVGLIPEKAKLSKMVYKSIPAEIRNVIGYKKLPGEMTKKNPSKIELFMLKTILKADVNLKAERHFIEPILKFFDE